MCHYSKVNYSSVTFADKLMEGRGKTIATIYGSSVGTAETGEGLADNKRGGTRSTP